MSSSVYIETSIISYLTARPSRDLFVAACQQATAEWWELRARFELFSSPLVVSEAMAGDAEAAARRMSLLRDIPELAISEPVTDLAAALVSAAAIPPKGQADALHIATAAIHGIDYLLTWNCRHIDNPAQKPAIRAICLREGFVCPEICTPFEILEVYRDEE